MWNEKCLRIRALKDQLGHQAFEGHHPPTFEKSIAIILEIAGATHSPKYLNWCRKQARKLRDRTPDMTPEQVKRITYLDERLFEKQTKIEERAAKRAERKAKKKEEAKAAPATEAAQETPWG